MAAPVGTVRPGSRNSRPRRRRPSASPSLSPKPAPYQNMELQKAKHDDTLRATRTTGGADDCRWTLCLCLIISQLVWYRSWNETFDSLLGIERVDLVAMRGTPEEFRVIDWQPLVLMLPLLGLAFHDMRSNPSKQFIHILPDYALNYVLRVAGGYGIVQVLAQDLGIRTGLNQRNLVQHPVAQFIMLWGGAYALTGHRSEGMVSALLYFVLKLSISGNSTSSVCFEDV